MTTGDSYQDTGTSLCSAFSDLGYQVPAICFCAGKISYLPRNVAPESESRQGSPEGLFHIWHLLTNTSSLWAHRLLWGSFWGLSGSLCGSVRVVLLWKTDSGLRVEFLLQTDSGYPRDAEVTLFTLANPGSFFALWVCVTAKEKNQKQYFVSPSQMVGRCLVSGKWSRGIGVCCRVRGVSERYAYDSQTMRAHPHLCVTRAIWRTADRGMC